MGRARHISYSDAELIWIGQNCQLPRKELHDRFVKTWGRLDVTYDNLKALCWRKGWKARNSGRFEKGALSHNKGKKGVYAPGSEKGWFAKGERKGKANQNYQPVGTERISGDGYVARKINDDLPFYKRWAHVHRLNWVAANGPVPDGHRLKCLDGNKLNVAAENWIAVPLAIAPRLNGIYGRNYDSAPAELKPAILATARLAQAVSDIKKGKKNL